MNPESEIFFKHKHKHLPLQAEIDVDFNCAFKGVLYPEMPEFYFFF